MRMVFIPEPVKKRAVILPSVVIRSILQEREVEITNWLQIIAKIRTCPMRFPVF